MPRLVSALVLLSLGLPLAAKAEDWPCWRGPSHQGDSSEKGLPLRWSATENVAWKTAIPGQGWSSPIVSGEQVFLTATTEEGAACHIIALDRQSGKIVWDKEVHRQTPTRKEARNSYATPTPAADGERVYAVFSDGTIVAVSRAGEVLWTCREHQHYSQHGLAASPLLQDDLLIMPYDGSSEGDDKKVGWQTPWDQAVILAVDKKTGKVRWRARRGMSRIAHVTPNVWRGSQRTELVSAAGDVIQGFDPPSGRLLWTAKTFGEGVVPSVVLGDGLAFFTSGFGRPTIHAVRPGGEGDVTKTHMVWNLKQAVPKCPSFVYANGCLFTIDDGGVAQCIDGKSGEVIWQERLGGNFAASPVHGDGKIYLTGDRGVTFVIAAARKYDLLAENPLDGERCQASMAISGGKLLIRTEGHLYCIGGKP